MEHVLLVLLGIREVVRQVKELTAPGYGCTTAQAVVCSNYLNVTFGIGAVLVGLGGFWPPLVPVGWIIAGLSLLIGTQVPCGFQVVNQSPWMWWMRQLLFVALGSVCIAHALGSL